VAGTAALLGQGTASARPASSPLRRSPNDELRIGVVGVGRRGVDHVASLGYPTPDERDRYEPIPGTRVVAVCDAFQDHVEIAARQVALTAELPGRYFDHRTMLEKEDLDVVVIATPDHLHVPIAIDAARAGCDVYVEKCMSNDVEQALELGRVLEQTGRIVQVGLQLHQDRMHRVAAEIIASGALGDVHTVQLFFSRNGPEAAWNRKIAENGGPPRDRVHWEQFLGDAPEREYDPHRFFEWRRYWDYSTGISGDLFSHALGAAHKVLALDFPGTASASGGVYHWRDGRETPDSFNAMLEYPDRRLSVSFLSSLSNQYQGHMTRILGDDASMELSWELRVYPDRFSTRYAEELKRGEMKATEPMLTVRGDGQALVTDAAPSELWLHGRGLTRTVRDGRVVNTTRLHHEELIDCVRTRKAPSAGYATALTSTIGCHLATESYRSGRRVGWDAAASKLTGLPDED